MLLKRIQRDFNFTGRYLANTNVDWLVRIMRGGLATNIYPWAWAPARFDWPNSNPNAATTQQRPFYINTINYAFLTGLHNK